MIFETITTIMENRKKEKRVPICAMLDDVIRLSGKDKEEVMVEVQKLKEDGKIAIKDTINSFSIYLK